MKKKHILIVLICFNAVCYSQDNVPSEFSAKMVTRKEFKKIQRIYGELLDNVGLYTILGDFKPASYMFLNSYTKYESITKRNDKRVTKKTNELRSILEKMTNKELHFTLYNPQQAYTVKGEDTTRFWRIPPVLVMNKSLVRKVIKEDKDFFNSISISENSNMDSIAKNVFIDRTCDYKLNVRAQGLLFGYPKYAIEFFVNTDYQIGAIKDRKPVKIPVYDKNSSFIYVIPIQQQLSNEDSLLINNASKFLKKYKGIRKKYINFFKYKPYKLYTEWSN